MTAAKSYATASTGAPAGTSGGKLYDYGSLEIEQKLDLAHLKAGDSVTNKELIPASANPTEVVVKTTFASSAAPRKPSVGYIAAMRRRQAQSIIKQIDALGSKVAREDFVTCTLPVVESIRAAIDHLEDEQSEGNAREVLRRVRDSLMNGGWKDYLRQDVRWAARETISSLLGESVTPMDAEASFDRLSRAGANPVGIPLFALGDEDENGEEGNEVSN